MGKTEREYMESTGWLTVYTAAKRIGWSPNRIYRAIDREELATQDAGGIVYLSEVSLLEYAGEALAALYAENKRAEK